MSAESTASEAASARVAMRRVACGSAVDTMDDVAMEAPLEIRVEGRTVAITMRTPGHDRELAAGFLLSEGVIAQRGDVFEISTCPSRAEGGGVVDVLLARPEAVDFARLTRHVFTASSCGLCGKSVVEDVLRQHPPLPAEGPLPEGFPVAPELIFSLPEKLRAAQAAFEATGGLHASALFDAAGNVLAIHEDVGRHNALDKVLGEAWLTGRWPLDRHLLLLSGRVSFELAQKALAARIPVVAAISAPSSLAIATAEAGGLTLCGFVREGRMNVYAHPRRIALDAETNGGL